MEWLKRLFASMLRRKAREGGATPAAGVAGDAATAPPATAELAQPVPMATVSDAAAAPPAPQPRLEPEPEPEPELERGVAPAPEPAPLAPSPPVEPAPSAPVETVLFDPDLAPVLRPAAAAFARGEFKSALAVATARLDDRDATLRCQALRLCAQSLAGLERWDDAFDHWLALFDEQPDARNALQLATASVMCDEAERGEAWLERFDRLNAGDLPPAQARREFIAALATRGRVSLALPHLHWLRDAYLQLRDTDPALLRQHGMPPFETFLAESLPVLRGALSSLDVHSWYSALEGRLDPRGRQHLRQWLTGLSQAA